MSIIELTNRITVNPEQCSIRTATTLMLIFLPFISSFAQKPIDLNDCQTINRIMNDTVIKSFLHTTVDRMDRCVFYNNNTNSTVTIPIKISCRFIEIDDKNYKIYDSSEIALARYALNQIVQIFAFSTAKDDSISFYLEWMERGAEFEILRRNNEYKISLIRIDRLD